MAQCGQMIEGNVVAFACDLAPNHDGPHRAYENARSVRERERWEAKQREDAETPNLAAFQGRPQTTAERYTENPTPVPQTREQQQEQREARRTPPPDAAGLGETDDDIPDVPAEHEHPVVFTAGADGSEFRQASPAEAKVAGLTEPGPNQRVAAQQIEESTLSEPTKTRPGDQPLPIPTQGEYVQERIIGKIERLRPQIGDEQADFLIAQMQESMRVGTQRYGTPLQTFNGRDCLQDLADELRDANVYINSLMQAREAQREVLVEAVQRRIEEEYADGFGKDAVLYEVPYNAEALAKMAVDTILKATGGFDT